MLEPAAAPVTLAYETQTIGQVTCWEAKIVPIIDATGAVTRLIAVARDITKRKMAEEQLAALNRDLAAQATTDSLTGLANRRRLDEALNQEWRRAARDGTQLSMMLIDLDHFKLFNDQYGHQLGDACLQATAKAIRRFVRRPARCRGALWRGGVGNPAAEDGRRAGRPVGGAGAGRHRGDGDRA